MSTPHAPKPAKLVIGLFLSEKNLLSGIAGQLSELFGPVDTISGWLPFDYTGYYEPEMGSPLYRRIFSFKTLIEQTRLADIKTATNRIEQAYVQNGRRSVNIDPGYLLLERFVLATGKNFTHRIYIGRGIYADLTLIYQKNRFQTLPWTYPDYADEPVLNFLTSARNKYADDIKRQGLDMQRPLEPMKLQDVCAS